MATCETCRFWRANFVANNFGMQGKCNNDHRYYRYTMPDGSVALMDSFGLEDTRANQTCAAHQPKDTTNGK